MIEYCGARKNGSSAFCAKELHYDGEHEGRDLQGELHTWMHDSRFDMITGDKPGRVFWKNSSVPTPRPKGRI